MAMEIHNWLMIFPAWKLHFGKKPGTCHQVGFHEELPDPGGLLHDGCNTGHQPTVPKESSDHCRKMAQKTKSTNKSPFIECIILFIKSYNSSMAFDSWDEKNERLILIQMWLEISSVGGLGGMRLHKKRTENPGYPGLIRHVHYWLVVSTPLKNMKVNWEGLSHILWKIKHVPNHQPDYFATIYATVWYICVSMSR